MLIIATISAVIIVSVTAYFRDIKVKARFYVICALIIIVYYAPIKLTIPYSVEYQASVNYPDGSRLDLNAEQTKKLLDFLNEKVYIRRATMLRDTSRRGFGPGSGIEIIATAKRGPSVYMITIFKEGSGDSTAVIRKDEYFLRLKKIFRFKCHKRV